MRKNRTPILVGSILILALLFRDSAGLSSGGRGFLAFVAYAIATFVVWLLYGFTQAYMTPAMLATGVVVLAGILFALAGGGLNAIAPLITMFFLIIE